MGRRESRGSRRLRVWRDRFRADASADRWTQFAQPRSRGDRIARIDALATLLDTAFILPGINVRFGLDALIGLVPGIGDAITTAMSLYIVHEARQLGAPRHLIVRMLGNVLLDGFVGAVPLAGANARAATSDLEQPRFGEAA